MSKGGCSGAVDSDSKPGMGMGHHWDCKAADGTEEDSPRVVGYLGKVALAALMVGVCWECSAGVPVKTLLCPFLLVQN
jgi:hypothetical protein